jgi:3-phenylpropionate/trans-cinnamate dioxygenase ferredoxin subunit
MSESTSNDLSGQAPDDNGAPQFVEVAASADIPEKGFRCFRVEDIALVLCRFRDEVFAVENLCSHALASFDEGRMRGYRLMCPLHGATFDIRDGAVTGAPATRPIKSFPVRLNNDKIEVDISGAEPTPQL